MRLPLALRAGVGLLLLAGCDRAPVCVQAQGARSRLWVEASRFEERQLLGFDAFIVAHPPDGAEALIATVEKLCGPLVPPDAGVAVTQWLVFRETRATPRTVVLDGTKNHTTDLHQDDLLLDLDVHWKGCRGKVGYSYYPDGYGRTDPMPPVRHYDLARGCEPARSLPRRAPPPARRPWRRGKVAFSATASAPERGAGAIGSVTAGGVSRVDRP